MIKNKTTKTTDEENVRIVKIPKRQAVNPQTVYDETYIPNMKRRGLESEVKPFSEWIRRIKTKKDGNEVVREVAGDTGESKEERGTRLLTAYFNSAIESLDRLKNLSSSQYKLSEKQVTMLHEKLIEKINEIESALSRKTKESTPIDFSKV